MNSPLPPRPDGGKPYLHSTGPCEPARPSSARHAPNQAASPAYTAERNSPQVSRWTTASDPRPRRPSPSRHSQQFRRVHAVPQTGFMPTALHFAPYDAAPNPQPSLRAGFGAAIQWGMGCAPVWRPLDRRVANAPRTDRRERATGPTRGPLALGQVRRASTGHIAAVDHGPRLRRGNPAEGLHLRPLHRRPGPEYSLAASWTGDFSRAMRLPRKARPGGREQLRRWRAGQGALSTACGGPDTGRIRVRGTRWLRRLKIIAIKHGS